jgi:hypothetical protein
MPEIEAKAELVAYCGLYCGACKSHLKGKCPGCHENAKASWCKVRACCQEKQLSSCAACTEFPDPRACKKYNNPMSRLVGFVLRSDRAACIDQIKRLGLEGHATTMAAARSQTIRR